MKHRATYCREIQDTVKKYREKRASKGQTAESYGCIQILSCHICGCLKIFVHYRPDREVPQTYSGKYKREILRHTVRKNIDGQKSVDDSLAT
jgi:hypothetical protein